MYPYIYTHTNTKTHSHMHTSLALSLSLSHERVSCAELQHATASSSMMQQEVQEHDKDTRHHRTCTGLATGMPLLPVSALCLWLVCHNTDAPHIYLMCRRHHLHFSFVCNYQMQRQEAILRQSKQRTTSP